MDRYYDTNRKNWNERTPIHARSRFYDLEGFRAGRNSLLPVELAEVGDVAGQSLLHLQCHMGCDTLSWARLGAQVTGVEFSEEALGVACGLRDDLGLEARFVLANLYDLPTVLQGQFDIVYTSYGALCWLHDLPRWAEIATSYVKPGGFLYVADFHPMAISVCDGGVEGGAFRMTFPYFPQAEPIYCEAGPTYTDGDEVTKTGDYEWAYSLGQVVTAICDAGLRLEFLHEHLCSACNLLPGMRKDEHGLWWREEDDMPQMFSVKAWKDCEAR